MAKHETQISYNPRDDDFFSQKVPQSVQAPTWYHYTTPRPSIYPLYALNRYHILPFKGYKEGPGREYSLSGSRRYQVEQGSDFQKEAERTRSPENTAFKGVIGDI